MHSLVSGGQLICFVMAEGPEMAGEFAFVPRIGVAAWLGGWVMGTDHGWPCESAEPS